MFKKLLRSLLSGWFISLVGVVILALLVWFLGPLLAFADVRPLESDVARFVTVLVILIVWGLANIFVLIRSRRADQEMMEGIVAAPAGPEAGAAGDGDSESSAEEVGVLKDRLQEAMAMLKKAKLGGRGGRQYLYQLPWYIVIGPPGAGKTTALVNSGLKFPLSDKLGKDPISGVGGTRNCDWWFTNEAVLIDTAGRYTTQDSNQAVDSSAWSGFLDLLKKYRPRQPINGAVIALSLADLATRSESERLAEARTIKRRINELHESLGIRFPVYVLFTKADLIAGFTEFFDDLGREDRAQVWGMTFPLADDKGEKSAVVQFEEEFDRLLERLNERMLERLQQETDIQRRSLIFGFPQQMASLRETARDFLNEVFLPTRYEASALVRGVYFTSGTQDGTPIDRLMSAMAKTFGIGRQALSAASATGRSYFITRLLSDVVFAEAGMVSSNRKVERRQAWIRRGAIAACAVAVVAMAGIWVNSYSGNQDLIAEAQSGMDTYLEQVGNINLNRVDDFDIVSVRPPLNTLRDLPGGHSSTDADVPAGLTFGLYQGDKIGSQAMVAYRRGLNRLFLPRLLLRLEEQMRANISQVDFLYEALKVYLMLGLQGEIDGGLIREWMAFDWNQALPGSSNEPVRADLAGHLAALLSQPMAEIPLNGPLVAQVREVLARVPLAERAYSIIKQSPAVRDLPTWRVIEHGGPASSRVFVRPSGSSLNDGIEGLYTYDGFHKVFLPAVADVSQQVAGESWVLGPRGEISLDDDQVDRLTRDVYGLYLDDYATRWDRLLADLAITPFQSMSHAVEVLNSVSGPNSPLINLLQAVSVQTTLTKTAGPIEVGAATSGILDIARQEIEAKLSDRTFQLSRILGRSVTLGQGAAPPAPGQFIDDRFARLNAFVAKAGDAPSQLDGMIAILTELYRELTRVSAATSQNTAALSVATSGGGTAAKRLLDEARRMPQPVQGWAAQLAQTSSTITVSGARAQLDADWKTKVLPLCRQALGQRYPFVKEGAADVTLQDFGKIFGPGGLIDSFFNTNLRPFVDTSTKPWQWRRVDNVDLGIPPQVLTAFQRAEEIRYGLFGAGGAVPSVQFELTPVDLDAASTQVILDIGGQSVAYSHGPPRPVRMQWPAPQGPEQVRISFSPSSPGTETSVTRNGPWAWFRILDEAEVSGSTLSDRFNVTFRVGERRATFELRAASVVNPFSLKALEQFRCPNAL